MELWFGDTQGDKITNTMKKYFNYYKKAFLLIIKNPIIIFLYALPLGINKYLINNNHVVLGWSFVGILFGSYFTFISIIDYLYEKKKIEPNLIFKKFLNYSWILFLLAWGSLIILFILLFLVLIFIKIKPISTVGSPIIILLIGLFGLIMPYFSSYLVIEKLSIFKSFKKSFNFVIKNIPFVLIPYIVTIGEFIMRIVNGPFNQLHSSIIWIVISSLLSGFVSLLILSASIIYFKEKKLGYN